MHWAGVDRATMAGRDAIVLSGRCGAVGLFSVAVGMFIAIVSFVIVMRAVTILLLGVLMSSHVFNPVKEWSERKAPLAVAELVTPVFERTQMASFLIAEVPASFF